MQLVPFVVYCAMSYGQPTNICTTIEDFDTKYYSHESCNDRAYQMLNIRGLRQRAIDVLDSYNINGYTGKIYYTLYCIPRNKVDDFLYNYIGVKREEQDI